MTGNVILKSFPNGIRVRLAKEPDFEQILKETRESFADAADFFKEASVALQFQGRNLTEEESERLLEAITGVCNLHIICLVCTDEDANDYYTKLIEDARNEAHQSQENSCQFYKGTLRDGEVFESSSSVVILGNVEKGAAVIAKGNVIVLGSLCGTAYAGADDRQERFIAALYLDAENLRIAGLKYKKNLKEKLTIKNKKLPKMVTAAQDKLVIGELDFTKELPENNLL
ncbi:MAG: septum site-determining protein MinC [Lachnospiraceae bacterium]|nr:septum site-determining protein MinC [Lachnospiraceae bacterium]